MARAITQKPAVSSQQAAPLGKPAKKTAIKKASKKA